MGIIKRVGEAITGIGERTERAGQGMLSSIGYRSRSHALRSRIESLKVPELIARKRKKVSRRSNNGAVVSTRKARAAAYREPASNSAASNNANTTEIVFRGG